MSSGTGFSISDEVRADIGERVHIPAPLPSKRQCTLSVWHQFLAFGTEDSKRWSNQEAVSAPSFKPDFSQVSYLRSGIVENEPIA